MVYSLNIGEWNSVFAVPSSVVDKYIKLAGENSLKLLLYLLRHGGEEIPDDKLSEELGFTEMGELEDAALFWVQRGIIKYNKDNPSLLSPVSENNAPPIQPNTEITEKTLRKPAPVSVSSGEIAVRIREDEEIKFLFGEAERLYGRMLRQRETQLVISLTDHYGLPAAVAAMLLGYCFRTGQTSPSYITAVAQGWAEDEITTVELADAKIHSLEKQSSVEERLRAAMGMNSKLTKKMRDYIEAWTTKLGFNEEMIMLAYEETVNRIQQWKPEYANTILESWNKQGVKTPADVAKAMDEWRKNNAKNVAKPTTDNRKSSFDMGSVVSQLKGQYKNGT